MMFKKGQVSLLYPWETQIYHTKNQKVRDLK